MTCFFILGARRDSGAPWPGCRAARSTLPRRVRSGLPASVQPAEDRFASASEPHRAVGDDHGFRLLTGSAGRRGAGLLPHAQPGHGAGDGGVLRRGARGSSRERHCLAVARGRRRDPCATGRGHRLHRGAPLHPARPRGAPGLTHRDRRTARGTVGRPGRRPRPDPASSALDRGDRRHRGGFRAGRPAGRRQWFRRGGDSRRSRLPHPAVPGGAVQPAHGPFRRRHRRRTQPFWLRRDRCGAPGGAGVDRRGPHQRVGSGARRAAGRRRRGCGAAVRRGGCRCLRRLGGGVRLGAVDDPPPRRRRGCLPGPRGRGAPQRGRAGGRRGTDHDAGERRGGPARRALRRRGAGTGAAGRRGLGRQGPGRAPRQDPPVYRHRGGVRRPVAVRRGDLLLGEPRRGA